MYEEEGFYSVTLSVSDDYGSDSQVIVDLINYTNDPISMEGFDCNEECQTGFVNATLIATDSYGDGWNGNSLSISINGTILNQYTLESGSYQETSLCIPAELNNNCVEIIVQEGDWPEEVSWTLVDSNNNILITGESPFYNDLYSNCPIYGCTNENAINYNPEANTDDGSCCVGSFYTILMEDGYGDGWNGNSLLIDTHILTLQDGSEGEEIICVPSATSCVTVVSDGEGGWPEEISWYIYNDQEQLILSGGAPYEGCFLEGCSDPNACNYNIEVTIDDGSCEYADENGDCNTTIGILNTQLNNSKVLEVTDIIGRKIDELKAGNLYIIIRENGQIERTIRF